ncbi:MAG: hypothetical protein HOJ90_03280 [Alphaproteobacteria bacterium]|jgi:hypothetical protein|nr:hypothetical protein [Alphaproteobacteria bacterium]
MTLETSPHTNPANASLTRGNPVYCYSVTGIADPGLMPRITELWAKRGLMPERWHGGRTGMGEREMYVDIETSELNLDSALLIAELMRCIFGVSHVLLSEKRFAATA